MKRPKFSVICLIGYVYIIAAAGMGYLMPPSDTIKSLIAQPGLVLIPYLVGKPILFITRRFLSIKEESEFIINLLITWSLGIIFIVALEAILYVNYAFSLDFFTLILLLIGIPSIFIREKTDFTILKHKELAIAAIYGFFFSLFVTRFWKYPLTNDIDFITHTFYVTRIVIQNRPLLFYVDYLPAMHTLYAILMKLFSISPYNEPAFLLWSSRFILYPIYAVGLYLFTYQFSKNRLMSLLAALIGTSLINTTDGTLFPYHTAPKNYINILFIYGLYTALYLYEKYEEEIRNPIPYLFGLGCLLLLVFVPLYIIKRNDAIGYEIGWILPAVLIPILALPRVTGRGQRNFFLSMAILLSSLIFISKLQGLQAGGVILTCLFFVSVVSKISLKKARWVATIFASVTLLVFVLFHLKIVPYPSREVIGLYSQGSYLFGWDNLTKYIGTIYPSALLFLFTIGCIFPLLSRHENDKMFLCPIIMVSLILLAYFMPIPHSYGFLADAHPFIILLGTLSVFDLLQISRLGLRDTATFISLTFVMAFIVITVYVSDIKAFPRGALYLREQELQVFEVGGYIKENIKKDALIICDTWYDTLAAQYGGVGVLSPWKKGVFQDNYIDNYIKEIYLAETPGEGYEKAKTLSERRDFQIIAEDSDGKDRERFYKPPSEVVLLYNDPLALVLEGKGSMAKFFDPRYFEPLFVTKNTQEQRFFVFRVRPEPKSVGYENLVKNPSFEEGWRDLASAPNKWESLSHLWRVSLDEETKVNGDYSCKMETGAAQKMVWGGLMSDEISVEAGKTYLIESAIKTENASGSHLKLCYYEKNSYITIAFITDGMELAGWRRHSEFIEVPQGVDKVRIFLMAGWVADKSSGEAATWFDDIQLIGPTESIPLE